MTFQTCTTIKLLVLTAKVTAPFLYRIQGRVTEELEAQVVRGDMAGCKIPCRLSRLEMRLHWLVIDVDVNLKSRRTQVRRASTTINRT